MVQTSTVNGRTNCTQRAAVVKCQILFFSSESNSESGFRIPFPCATMKKSSTDESTKASRSPLVQVISNFSTLRSEPKPAPKTKKRTLHYDEADIELQGATQASDDSYTALLSLKPATTILWQVLPGQNDRGHGFLIAARASDCSGRGRSDADSLDDRPSR